MKGGEEERGGSVGEEGREEGEKWEDGCTQHLPERENCILSMKRQKQVFLETFSACGCGLSSPCI